MKIITMTPEDAEKFLGTLKERLKDIGLEMAIDTGAMNKRDLRSTAEVMREVTLTFEEDRKSAGGRGRRQHEPC